MLLEKRKEIDNAKAAKVLAWKVAAKERIAKAFEDIASDLYKMWREKQACYKKVTNLLQKVHKAMKVIGKSTNKLYSVHKSLVKLYNAVVSCLGCIR